MPLRLPIRFPFPPMEAQRVEEIPSGSQWQFEPKWDGFRAIVFRDGDEVIIQSKSLQRLDRYFPEMVEAFRALPVPRFVLDGELAVVIDGKLRFDELQLRLHPAESRIRRLSREIPARFFCFDLLAEPRAQGRGMENVSLRPLHERRERLEKFFRRHVRRSAPIELSRATCDRGQAERWFEEFEAFGLDGVVAKDANEPYHSGDREAMLKIKHLREADCVVGGFKFRKGTKLVSALTLGLYDEEGLLRHVGSTSTFTTEERKKLARILAPLAGRGGFAGEMPGQSRWSGPDAEQWIRVEPRLVCEVRYDQFSGGRFRHGAKFLRWRPDKKPRQCTFEQVERLRKRAGAAKPFAA